MRNTHLLISQLQDVLTRVSSCILLSNEFHYDKEGLQLVERLVFRLLRGQQITDEVVHPSPNCRQHPWNLPVWLDSVGSEKPLYLLQVHGDALGLRAESFQQPIVAIYDHQQQNKGSHLRCQNCCVPASCPEFPS